MSGSKDEGSMNVRGVHDDTVDGSANNHTPPYRTIRTSSTKKKANERTLLCIVKLIAGWIFSTPWRPGMPVQCLGGSDPAGMNPGARLKDLNRCRRRTMKYPASLSAKSCPKHFFGTPNQGQYGKSTTEGEGGRTARGPP